VKGANAGQRRRTVLVGLALGLAGLPASGLVACSPSGSSGTGSGATTAGVTAAPRRPTPDEQAAVRAVLSARSLLAGWTAIAATAPRLATLAAAVIADHRAHLAALGLPEPAVSTTGSGSGSASPAGASTTGAASPPASGSASVTVSEPPTSSALVAAERAAAEEALGDVVATTPATAGLLARIGAARAVHADLLAAAVGLPAPSDLGPSAGPTSAAPTSATPTSATATPTASDSSPTSPTGTGSPGTGTPATSGTVQPLDGATAAALSSLLTGEHAAVFAYGLVTARLAPPRQAAARLLWTAHRIRRNALAERLVAAGLTPPEAAPAYDLGSPPVTPAQVVALAARVEDGLASVALVIVTTTTGPTRAEGAGELVAAARRAASWRGTPTPLPG